jgi:hypothetical protein
MGQGLRVRMQLVMRMLLLLHVVMVLLVLKMVGRRVELCRVVCSGGGRRRSTVLPAITFVIRSYRRSPGAAFHTAFFRCVQMVRG